MTSSPYGDVRTATQFQDVGASDRYGDDFQGVDGDAQLYPETSYPQADYPHTGEAASAEYTNDVAPELEHPAEFYVARDPRYSKVAPDWAPRTLQLVAGGQPVRLIALNLRRKRIRVWTDASNTGPVYLSNDNSGTTGTGSTSVALGPGSANLEMDHTGPIYAFAAAQALVYFVEENYAQ